MRVCRATRVCPQRSVPASSSSMNCSTPDARSSSRARATSSARCLTRRANSTASCAASTSSASRTAHCASDVNNERAMTRLYEQGPTVLGAEIVCCTWDLQGRARFGLEPYAPRHVSWYADTRLRRRSRPTIRRDRARRPSPWTRPLRPPTWSLSHGPVRARRSSNSPRRDCASSAAGPAAGHQPAGRLRRRVDACLAAPVRSACLSGEPPGESAPTVAGPWRSGTCSCATVPGSRAASPR